MFVLPRHIAAAGLAAVLAASGAAVGSVQAQAVTAAPSCAVTDLYLSMGRVDIGAGQIHWPIQFTNTSTMTCTLHGFPGVSVLDIMHHQIGPAATRNGQPITTVVVHPAQTVTAVIHTTNGPLGGPCEHIGTYLRVFPPNSRQSALIPAALRVCSHVFDVGPITP